MDKLFLDTNFLLDAALSGRPGSQEAAQLFTAITRREAIGLVAACSLKDFYYIARRDLGEELERRWLRLFADACYIPATDRDSIMRALESDEPDFEDGLLRAIAEIEDANYIITRDAAAFVRSPIPKLTASEYLSTRQGSRKASLCLHAKTD